MAFCRQCRKTVGATSYGRRGVCGEVIAEATAPSTAQLVAADASRRAVANIAMIVLAVGSVALIAVSFQKGNDGKVYVMPWTMIVGAMMLIAVVRSLIRRLTSV